MDSGQYEFGAYRLDVQGRILFKEGDRVALPPKVAELLVALVQAAGRVLTREQLLQSLWPDTVVEEGSLTSHISMLRKALGERSAGAGFHRDLAETRLPVRGVREAGLHPGHRTAGSIGPCWWSCRSRTSPPARDTTTSATG